MLPTLCDALGLDRLTNCSIRPTAIRNMKRAGIEDREVATISGHKNIATLQNYAPQPPMKRRKEISRAIGSGGRLDLTMILEENNDEEDELPKNQNNEVLGINMNESYGSCLDLFSLFLCKK